jgi:phosphatidylserine/phosphatidylglycerophosphate/cardiolipin synthase-like enzyme
MPPRPFRHHHALATVPLLLLLAVAPVAEQRDRPAPPRNQPPAVIDDDIAIFFSPGGGAMAAIGDQINSARRTLDVQAYLLTTKDIAGPIARAHERGVKVRVILDKDKAGDEYSSATYLANAGVSVWLDDEHKEAHNKLMLIDGQTIVTGSFNFTRAADEENAENLLIMTRKPKLFAAYAKNFEAHLAHAKPYKRRAAERR